MKARDLKAVFPLVMLFLVSCRDGNGQADESRLVKVETKIVTPEASGENRCYTGVTEEESGTPLSFSVAGTVRAVHINLGQYVHSGQLMATLDPTGFQYNYNVAQSALEQAEDVYSRMKELYDKGSLPEMKWVEVQNKLKQAHSMEQIAAKALNDTKLYAPFDGLIAEDNIAVGQNVMPGVTVARLITASELKVKIPVPETEISHVFIGQEAVVIVPALDGKTLHGKVVEKGVVANMFSRSYDVIVRIEDRHEGLMPGMVADVTLKSGQVDDEYIVIPADIVQLDEYNRYFVWSVKDGKANKSFIRLGGYVSDGVVVLDGIAAGTEIIVKGQHKVCEGTEVEL